MKIERTKNATRNIIFGMLLRLYQILIPFVLRTSMIYCMGVQYLGLNSLFTSVLQVLNLAELGVGSAMVYCMYKPIAEDDRNTICALMKLYRLYYRIIGLVIAVIGIVLVPFIPKLVKGNIPVNINIYVLYLLNLGTTVLSYWLFAYRNSLVTAHQREDITSKVTLISSTLMYVTQLSILYFVRNYYLYIIVALLSQVFTNIITAIVTTKMYPQYKPVGKLDKSMVSDINQRIRDLFTTKAFIIIIGSTDTIIISAFLGLVVLAVYQNYYYIISSIIGIMTVIYSACYVGIGNSIIVETKEKNFNDLKKFTLIISWIVGFCTVCLFCLFQPFMQVWVGKELQLDFLIMSCLCLSFYIGEINHLLNIYKDAAGLWRQDLYRPIVTALAKLLLNLILVHFWGINGVILSSVFSNIFIGIPWLLRNLFTHLFERKNFVEYFKRLSIYAVITLFACLVTGGLCYFVRLNVWLTLITRAGICFIIPNIIFYIAFRNFPEFKLSLLLLDKMTNNKLSKIRIVVQKIGKGESGNI